MTPSEKFNKPIIGNLLTRVIKEIYVEGHKASATKEVKYDIIDVVPNPSDKMNLYITNTWGDAEETTPLFIHENFIKYKNIFKGKENGKV